MTPTSPSSNSTEHRPLAARLSDSGDNSVDFVLRAPSTPKNSSTTPVIYP